MPRQTPYLLRRGDTLSFRIAVPGDLRLIIGERELTKTLRTSNKCVAAPIALEFAATAKRLFTELRIHMTESSESKLRELLIEAKGKLRLQEERERHENELIELQRQHLKELKHAKLEAQNESLRLALAATAAAAMPSPLAATEHEAQTRNDASTPTFHHVVDRFLEEYPSAKMPSMLKKHKTVLSMLKEFIGDIPITRLRQSHVNDFFALLHRLPPRWKDQCRQRNMTFRQLAELKHLVTLGPKSFDDTYIASIRPFLEASITAWQDEGFPPTLTTRAIKYRGDREEGEEKQRALTQAELKRLFEGPEVAEFAADSANASCYWLPHIGLFTGARVNEICQLNPQTDILQDAETGIWYFWITEHTDADERIVKSTKNDESRRKVPIHSKLIELGILEYVRCTKADGAKLIFPDWKPLRGKASPKAEKWFGQLLRKTGLRDETKGAMVLGMHVFRHTLESKGENTKGLPWPIEHITGHAIPGKSKVARGYAGELELHNKKEILEAISFHLSFAKPMAPQSRVVK